MAVTKAVSLKAGIGQSHKNAVELAKNTEVIQITIIPDIFYFHFSGNSPLIKIYSPV